MLNYILFHLEAQCAKKTESTNTYLQMKSTIYHVYPHNQIIIKKEEKDFHPGIGLCIAPYIESCFLCNSV